jgi:hypothetical protein
MLSQDVGSRSRLEGNSLRTSALSLCRPRMRHGLCVLQSSGNRSLTIMSSNTSNVDLDRQDAHVDRITQLIQSTGSFVRQLFRYKQRPEFQAADLHVKAELLHVELFVCSQLYQQLSQRSPSALQELEQDSRDCESESELIQLLIQSEKCYAKSIDDYLNSIAVNLINTIRLIKWLSNCVLTELNQNDYSGFTQEEATDSINKKIDEISTPNEFLHSFISINQSKYKILFFYFKKINFGFLTSLLFRCYFQMERSLLKGQTYKTRSKL